MTDMANITEINIMNVATVTPDELLDFMHAKYDEVIWCKEEGLDYSDLSTIQGFMGWCQNIESFLTPLIAKMDIVSRSCVTSKQPDSDYQLAMSKKTILTLYYNHIERLFKTLSRQCSLFTAQASYENDMERRSDNILKQASAIATEKPAITDEFSYGEPVIPDLTYAGPDRPENFSYGDPFYG